MSNPTVVGDEVWCPLCKKYVRLLKIQRAARVLDVKPRTIYRYIENNRVYAIKTAGNTYRVCSDCLLKQDVSG